MSGHFQSTDLPSQLLLLTTLRLITLAPNQNFTHARSGPVRALSEVLQRYLALLAGNARDVAHLSGREQASLEDVVGALENMGYSQTQMLRWAQDAANASPPDDEQKDLASLANLLDPQRGKKPEKRKRLSFRQATQFEQDTIVNDLVAVHHDGTLEDHDMAGASNEPQVSTSTQSDEEFTAQAAAWRSPEDVPNHIPPFLPPLPGFEQPFMPLPPQSAATMPLEPDNQPEAAANNKEEHAPRSTNSGALNMTINATADLQHKHGHVDPWKHVVPFDRSHLQLREPQLLPSNLPLPLKPTDVVNEDEALDSPTHSSLMAYFKLHRHLTTQPPVQPTWPKKSKRRQAAALLNRPEGAWDRFDLSNPSASIGGMVGAQRPRFTRKTPGWLPYPLHKPANPRDRKTAQQPVPILHPYDLQSDMLDPVSSPVIPSDMSDLSANLANLVGGSSARRAAAQDAGLPPGVKGFLRRTTRIAQPGPLGSNGETLPYSLVSGTDGDVAKRVVLGFEWPARDFTASLDGKDKNSQTEDQQAQPTSTQQADETAAIQELAPDQTTSQAQVHGSLASEKQAAAPVAEFTRVDDVMATTESSTGQQAHQVNGEHHSSQTSSSQPTRAEMSQFASDRPASSKMDVDIDSALIDSRPKNELQRRSAPPEVLKFAETVCRPSQTRVDEPSAAHTDAQASGPVTDMQLDEEAAPPAATSPLPSSVPNGDIPENGLSGPMPPRSTSPAPPLQPPLSDQNGEKSVEDPPRLPDPSPNTAVSGGPSESVSNSLEGVSLPSEQLHSRNGGVSSPEDPSLPVNTASMSMLPQQSQSDSTAPASDANHASTPSLTAADSFEGSQGPSLAGPESFESLQEPAQDRQSSRERILTPTPTQPSKPLKLNVKLGSLKQTASPAESTAPPVCSDGPTTT